MVSFVTGMLIFGAYCTYAYVNFQSGRTATEDMNFWAGTMLWFTGIGIVAAIVIQIIFHIVLSVSVAVQEKTQNRECKDEDIESIIQSEMITDEMDRLIELKSVRWGFMVVGVGFVIALVSQVVSHSSVVMLNILFGSFFVGSMIGSLSQLYYYKKGVTHG